MAQLQEDIKKYYEECDRSYQHWGGEGIYNIHYGYWEKGIKSHVEALNNMNRILAEKLRIKPGDKILDAGCGVGASAIWLAKNYDVEVVGITLSELQCKKANDFAGKEGVSNRVRFYVMDFSNTTFPNTNFDIVWGLESVCYAPDKRAFVKEVYRILREGGKLIVADGFINKKDISKLNRFFLNNWLKGWKVPSLAGVSDFNKYLEEEGFKNINFTDITKNIFPSSREIFKRGLLGWPVYKFKGKNQFQIDHVKGCIFQYPALKKGAWIYGIFYAEK